MGGGGGMYRQWEGLLWEGRVGIGSGRACRGEDRRWEGLVGVGEEQEGGH